MASVIRSVSLPYEMFQFVKAKNLNLSQLLQAKIKDIMQDTDVNFKEVFRKMTAWQETANKMRDFLEEKNLIDEFLKEKSF
jgi:arsenate reductase-like glutaredoxin family protein